MTEDRAKMGIKLRGKHCPRPVRTWLQCGLSDPVLRVIEKHGYKEPFAIQRQAIPAILNGRDVIGVAKEVGDVADLTSKAGKQVR